MKAIPVIPVTGRITSDTVSSFHENLKKQISESGSNSCILDASGLTYLSSAALRVILMILKEHIDLTFENVSPEVYEILDMTGFTHIMKVLRKPREIDVTGLEMIAHGSAGEVYRLNNEKIVKLCYPGISQSDVEMELESVKKAFFAGIPTTVGFENVMMNGRYGMVYELIEADTFGHTITQHPDQLEKYADMYVSLLKKLARTRVSKTEFTPGMDIWKKWYNSLVQVKWDGKPVMDAKRCQLMETVFNWMPEGDSFVHNDPTPANIMIQHDEPIMIDLGDASYGHPLMDLSMVVSGQYNCTPVNYPRLTGMAVELREPFMDLFFRKYFRTNDTKELEQIWHSAHILRRIRGALFFGRGIGGFKLNYAEALNHIFDILETESMEEIRKALDFLGEYVEKRNIYV